MEPESQDLATLVAQLSEENARLRVCMGKVQILLDELKTIRAKRILTREEYFRSLSEKGKAEIARIINEK